MRDAFVSELLAIMKEDKNVYLLTGDLGFGVLQPLWDEVPKQVINAGIAEQNLTTVAAGMALEGKIVFTYSIGNFPTIRCLEQIRNDCAYHNANVKIVCIGGGYVYGSLGMSHHATEDLALLRALPNVTVIAPADAREARGAVRAMYETPGTFYFRIGRGGEPIVSENSVFELGKAIKHKAGQLDNNSKTVLFSTGAIFDEIQETIILLEQKGIGIDYYTFPTIKPLDAETIKKCAVKNNLIVTVEEQNINGGFGGAVSEVVADMEGLRARVLKIGINDVYCSVVGNQKYLRDYNGLSGAKIAQTIVEALHE